MTNAFERDIIRIAGLPTGKTLAYFQGYPNQPRSALVGGGAAAKSFNREIEAFLFSACALGARGSHPLLGSSAPLEGRGGDLLPAHRAKLSLGVKWKRGRERSLKRRARAVLGERSTRARF